MYTPFIPIIYHNQRQSCAQAGLKKGVSQHPGCPAAPPNRQNSPNLASSEMGGGSHCLGSPSPPSRVLMQHREPPPAKFDVVRGAFGERSGAGCPAALPEPPEPRHVSACAVDVKCAVNLTELLFHALTYPLPSYRALSGRSQAVYKTNDFYCLFN